MEESPAFGNDYFDRFLAGLFSKCSAPAPGLTRLIKGDLIDGSMFARVAELADALDLGSSGQPWGFESPPSHVHLNLLIIVIYEM